MGAVMLEMRVRPLGAGQELLALPASVILGAGALTAYGHAVGDYARRQAQIGPRYSL